MSELKKHDITIRYIKTEYPAISSVYPPSRIAEKLFYDWWDHRWGPVPQVLDITVDGKVFTSIEETRK